jgi:hypothetical protein
MSIYQTIIRSGLAGVLGLVLCTTTLAADQPPPALDEAEVMTSGPVHEAYAEPVSAQPQPTPIIPKRPPDPIEEVPSEQKPALDNVQWIPGYWAWDDARGDFLWVSGFWRVPPPDRQWVPGYWSEAQGGWQWAPGFWADTTATQAAQAQVTYLPPPPPSLDTGPSVPAPVANSMYVPGNWMYAQTRYLWRPGFWLTPRAGWVWIPAHYVWTPSGYIFVDGYWDYVLNNRGLLFAPVAFAQPYWARPGWFYRPSYMVYPDFLLSALFVRPGAYSYYFGDYFDPRFARLGYRSWLDYRLTGSSPDPLFGYYRWQNRGYAGWLPGLQQLYRARFNGTAPRPPHTLVEQNRLVQNVQNRTVNVTNINHVVAVAPITKVDTRRTTTRLTAVTPTERQQVIQHAQQVHTARQNRTQAEVKLRPQAPVRTTDPARTGTLHVPPRPANAKVQGKTPPPRPVHPQHESRPIPKYEPPRPEIRTAPKAKPAPHAPPAAKKTKPPAQEKKAPEKKSSLQRQSARPNTAQARLAPAQHTANRPVSRPQAAKARTAPARQAVGRPASQPHTGQARSAPAQHTGSRPAARSQAAKARAAPAQHAAARPVSRPQAAKAHPAPAAHAASRPVSRPQAAHARSAPARPPAANHAASHPAGRRHG